MQVPLHRRSIGRYQSGKSLVEKALGKNAGGTLDSVRQQIEAMPFGFFRQVDSQNLLTFIIDEHPQTIALILSHLPPSYGAEILAGLPAERQLAVVRRIATMGQTNPEIIREVERGLEHRMASVMSQSFENAGGVATVAEVLNVTDRATERSLLENLGSGRSRPGRRNPSADVRLRGYRQVPRKRYSNGAEERREFPMGDGAQGCQRSSQGKSLGQYVTEGPRPAAGRNGLSRSSSTLSSRTGSAANRRYRAHDWKMLANSICMQTKQKKL